MSFLSKIANVMTGGLSGGIGSLAKGNAKGALGSLATGGVGGLFSGGGGRGPGRPRPVDPGAQSYLDSFSPEDQGSIRDSWGSNPNAQNDWFNNAKAAGVQMPASGAAPVIGGFSGGGPPAGMPGIPPGLMEKMRGGMQGAMGAKPMAAQAGMEESNQMAQDVRNERRKFRMGRMGGGGYTGMGGSSGPMME